MGALERCFTQVGSDLTRKQNTRLERLTKDKCLLGKCVTYSRKKFYNITNRWHSHVHTSEQDEHSLEHSTIRSSGSGPGVNAINLFFFDTDRWTK
jgi:hypothetical protein